MQIYYDTLLRRIAMLPLLANGTFSDQCQVSGCAEPTAGGVVFNDEDSGGNGTVSVAACDAHVREARTGAPVRWRVDPWRFVPYGRAAETASDAHAETASEPGSELA